MELLLAIKNILFSGGILYALNDELQRTAYIRDQHHLRDKSS